MKSAFVRWVPLVAVLGVFALVGCGGSYQATTLKGKVLFNGQPYKIEPSENLAISFSYEVEPPYRRSSAATVNPDGTFTVEMPHGKGFRLGKYQITATSTKYPESKPGDGEDKFKKAFADAQKTPLACEVTPQTREIIIDLGKGTVTTE